MDSIHAKCLAHKDTSSVMLICQKFRGYTSPQCYDSDEDVYFVPEYKPTVAAKKGK